MITDINDYFANGCGRCDRFASDDCSSRLWAEGQKRLRAICTSLNLDETVKWGHPCYVYKGRNIALIAAVRGDFRLNFFNASLLKDTAGILEKQGDNTRHPDTVRFTDANRVSLLEPTLRAYLQEAIGYADAGIKPEKVSTEMELPSELAGALEADPQLAEAFHKLTPGRQRSYVLNLNAAKKSETRIARISGFRERILAGKGLNER
ncbi:YdeI/OmpD-associated family protein [Thalassolituus sp. LLYu03]|uniref:YdeI/OmpD-associated family protein n=1 Tax=Thalassolituus sp. LLYu03 TaxID=3421656 RepID=UPI003D2DFF48